MKKILLCSLLLSSINLGISQTIATDDTLTAGDSQRYFLVDTASTSDLASSVGAGVTWDYSSLVMDVSEGSSLDTVIHIADSPYQSDYPAAQYHESFPDGIQTFFSNDANSDEVIIHGFVFKSGNDDFIVKYDVDQMIGMELPMALNDQINDNIEGEVDVKSFNITIGLTGTSNVIIDGTGTLKLGTSTYNDVVRQKTTEISNGSHQLFGPISVLRTSYTYYTGDTPNNFPVFAYVQVSIAIPNSGLKLGFKMIWSSVNTKSNVGLTEKASNYTLNIYPNPASDNISIESNGSMNSIEIYNAVGKLVYNKQNPMNQEQISIETLSSGIYFVKVNDAGKVLTRKLIIR